MGFNRRKMEDKRRGAAEKEAAERRATVDRAYSSPVLSLLLPERAIRRAGQAVAEERRRRSARGARPLRTRRLGRVVMS